MGEDSAEFTSFVRARGPALIRTAYLLIGDQHLAEDLVQTALAKTHLAWRRLRDTGHAEAYTRKIMYHQVISWWRRHRSREVVTDTIPEPGVVDADFGALRMTMLAALDVLPPKQRAVIVLRFYDDLTERETAEQLGCSIGTVKSYTARALQRLRREAPQLGITEDGVLA